MNKKTFILFLTFILTISINIFSQEIIPQNFNFKPFKQNEKWGFKKNNEIVIQAAFDYVTDFSENLALVQVNGKWGYIDTLGNWHIQAIYDKAQPMQEGRAFVQKDKFIGLISALYGNYLLEPIYTNIKEDYSAYYVFNDKKIGYFSKENLFENPFAVIPPIYDSIYEYYGIVSGQKEDKTWDVYFQGKLVIENISKKISSNDFNYSSKLFSVNIEGKSGVFSPEKGWIVKPNYSWIGFLDFPSYTNKDNLENQTTIIALHDKDIRNYNPEYWDYASGDPTDSISLVKTDGSAISNEKFNSVNTYYDLYTDISNPYAIQMQKGTKLYNVYSNFKIQKLNFSNLKSHYYNKWFIADGENLKYILDEKYKILDSFPDVRVYQEFSYIPEGYYDENGDYIYSGEEMYNFIDINEPFLLAIRFDKDQVEEKAVYSLEERKLISPWIKDPNNELTVKRNQIGAETLYTYNYQNNSGFYIKGMKKGTELIYFDEISLQILGNYFVLRSKINENDFTTNLFLYDKNNVILISDKYEVLNSKDIFTYEIEYDPETGEMMFDNETAMPISASKNVFQEQFLIVKNKENKYGLITLNNKLIAPKYDTISQNITFSRFISLIKNDSLGNQLFGNVDLYSGKIIEPFSSYELTFFDDLYINSETFYYAITLEKNFQSYIDQEPSLSENTYISLSGKKFKSRTDLLYAKKVKGKYGLFGYSIYSDKLTDVFQQVKPQYKMLEQSFIPGVYCAKGKNKKWGMINFIGDTVLPIKYDAFEAFDYNWDNTFVLSVTQNKKKGLYDMKVGEIVPCKYDKIEFAQFYDGDQISSELFITTIKGKLGLCNNRNVEIIPNEMDKIELEYLVNTYEPYIVATKKNKKIPIFLSQTRDLQKFDTKFLKEYDFIANGEGYIKKDKQFDIYSIQNNELINTVNFTEFELVGNNYKISIRDGKFGALDLNGKILVPFEYEFATFFEGRDEVMIGYQNGIKYYIYVENNERFTEQQW